MNFNYQLLHILPSSQYSCSLLQLNSLNLNCVVCYSASKPYLCVFVKRKRKWAQNIEKKNPKIIYPIKKDRVYKGVNVKSKSVKVELRRITSQPRHCMFECQEMEWRSPLSQYFCLFLAILVQQQRGLCWVEMSQKAVLFYIFHTCSARFNFTVRLLLLIDIIGYLLFYIGKSKLV